jgi:hypothetical protein
MVNRKNIVIMLLSAIFLLSGCATYYQQSIKFQEFFAGGDLNKAQSFLQSHNKAAEKKDRLLYFLDRGVVEQMLGNYQESNRFFEEAYLFSQDYRKNFSTDLVGMVANPMLKPYQGEDFELVLIHFYKAINFIQLNDLDAALVEVRRVNIKLNELNDKYDGKKNRYKEDAFAHTLMGIIYEAKRDYNNAFIAYRNAFEVYQSIYSEEFSVSAPEQLKKDLLRMAHYNGFYQEEERYEKEFGFTYQQEEEQGGELVFFWLNGLGPVKGEFSLNLSTINGDDGVVTFANEAEGFSIPYFTSKHQNTDPADFGDLKFVRMAIPKYRTREPLLTEAFLEVNKETFPLQKAEDVSQIAVSTLQDRMLREITKSVGRVALKQAAELAVREKNEELGSLVSIVNAFTEKADTRNWQTLPHSIYYQRIILPADTQNVSLITRGPNVTADTLNFPVIIRKGQTTFRTYHSLESTVPVIL